ncbi:DUF5119 domain-containing protein [Parabacteroides sp. OttesenSCG-928-G07]|nr:DUF5119 domain-containing protein [Parabacteroides sp. OttesenSCG-928-G07]
MHYGFATFTIQWDDLIPPQNLPKTIRYCFYPANNGAMIQTEGDAHSMKIALPPGSYRLIAFNSDIQNTQFHYMNKFDAAEAFLPVEYEQGEHTIKPLYATVVNEVKIIPGQNKLINISLSPMIQNVRFKININNPDAIQSCEASISGVASSAKFSTRNTGVSSRDIIPFTMNRSERGFERNLVLFDTTSESPTQKENNQLKLDFTLKDGRKVSSVVDLGNPIEAYDQQNIIIEIDATIEPKTSPLLILGSWDVKSTGTNPASSLL